MIACFRFVLSIALLTAIALKINAHDFGAVDLVLVVAEGILLIFLIVNRRSMLPYGALMIYSGGIVVYQQFIRGDFSGCACVGDAPAWVAQIIAGTIGLCSAVIVCDQVGKRIVDV